MVDEFQKVDKWEKVISLLEKGWRAYRVMEEVGECVVY